MQSQYVFVYNAVLEAVMCGETCVSVQGLRKRIEELSERVEGSEQTRYEVEFKKLLTTSSEVEFDCYVAASEANVVKNRYQTNLPSEWLAQHTQLLTPHIYTLCVCVCVCVCVCTLLFICLRTPTGDSARVVLIGREDENDYINASYIDVRCTDTPPATPTFDCHFCLSPRATTTRGPSWLPRVPWRVQQVTFGRWCGVRGQWPL